MEVKYLLTEVISAQNQNAGGEYLLRAYLLRPLFPVQLFTNTSLPVFLDGTQVCDRGYATTRKGDCACE